MGKRILVKMPKGKTRLLNKNRFLDREFLGKLRGFETKEEQKYEAAHLKAYKKGWEYFKFGKGADGYPRFHEVKQRYFTKEN